VREGATSVEYWPNGRKKSERTARASTTWFATGTRDTEDVFAPNGAGASKTAWYPNGQMMLRAQLDSQGQVAQLVRWNEDGRPVTAAEWAQDEEKKKEQMRSAAKVLELPLTILFSGLK
jgi:antitoxin component YwqK of YwqJK toxin-antitoxin module